MKTLICGCCGQWFKKWKGYVDQDQDKGYGICKDCQGAIADDQEKEYQRIVTTLRAGLNEDNRMRFDSLPREQQEALVLDAINEGVITFTVERNATTPTYHVRRNQHAN